MIFMKRLYFLLMLIFLLSSCKTSADSENLCIENCSTDPTWMKQLKNQVDQSCDGCYKSIFKGSYQGSAVYFVMMNHPLCNGIFGVDLINCEGQLVKRFDSDASIEYENEVTNKTVYHHCPGQIY